VSGTLDRLASEVQAGGGLLANAVTPAAADGAYGSVAASGRRAAGHEADYALLVEAIHEGYLLHYASGRVVRPEDVLGAPRRGRSIVLTGDTAPADSVVAAAAGADVLVHEATFLADERDRARETDHSTAEGAARVARDAGVKLLALTHLSARYAGSEVADEARTVFPQTVVPRDFDLIDVPLPERGPPVLVERGGRRPRRQDVGSDA